MATGVERYVDRCTKGSLSIEIAFNGGAAITLSDNPRETNVTVRLLRRANVHWGLSRLIGLSRWVEQWTQEYGDLLMPSEAWHGIKLCEIISSRLFVAVGSELSEIDAESGKAIWTLSTGNTPISWIMRSRDEFSLIVFNENYRFEHDDQLSNIASVALDGVEKWRAPLPFSDDTFANRPVFDGAVLKTSSWRGYTCIIDQLTGEITHRQFTK